MMTCDTALADTATPSAPLASARPAPSKNLITSDFLSGLSALNSTRVVRLEDISRAMAAESAIARAAQPPAPETGAPLSGPARPEPPSRVFAVFQGGSAHIVWDASPGAARGYNIYRVGADRCFELITPIPVKTERYTDPAPGADSGVVYYIEAVGADRTRARLSAPSAIIRAGFKIVN